jgi:hypothetical protein
VGATKVWEGVGKYIKFKDPVVESLCMKWSSDGVGLTHEDAAKVTDIGDTFRENSSISYFDEFENFTSVSRLGKNSFRKSSIKSIAFPKSIVETESDAGNYEGVFYECSSLEKIVLNDGLQKLGNSTFRRSYYSGDFRLPKSITYLGEYSLNNVLSNFVVYLPNLNDLKPAAMISSGVTRVENLGSVSAILSIWSNGTFQKCESLEYVNLPATITKIDGLSFSDCANLKIVIARSTIPPELSNYNAFAGTPSTMEIYVPDESVEAYKSATNWSAYADRIKPMSEYQPNNE